MSTDVTSQAFESSWTQPRVGRAVRAALSPWMGLALALLFALAMLVWAGDFITHHPDERHYTDGALMMLRHGDWLSPRTAEGDLRLLKPGVTYWLVAGSFRLLGYSPLAARLPFILCGAAVVALTWALGRRLLRSRRAAAVAALIALTNPLLALGAGHSIPEVVLTLALTVSALGFCAIVLRGQATPGNYALAWGGAGLAVATKGLLALAFVAYVAFFAAMLWGRAAQTAGGSAAADPQAGWRRRWWAAAQPFKPWAIALAVAIGGAWYGAIAIKHGMASLSSFWGDQVAGKVGQDASRPLWLMPALLLVLPLATVPWSLLAGQALARIRRQGRWRPARCPGLARFALGWCLLLVLIFGLAPNLSERYLMAAVPPLAVLLAEVLCYGVAPAWLATTTNRWLTVLGVLAAVAAVMLAWQAIHGLSVGLAAVGFLLLGCAILWRSRRLRGWTAPGTLALAICLMFLLAAVALRPLALPDQGRQIADALAALPLPPEARVLAVSKPALTAKIRVFTADAGPAVSCLVSNPKWWRPERDCPDHPDAVWLLPREQAARLPAGRYDLHTASSGYAGLPPGRLLLAALRGNLRQVLDDNRQHWVLAVPRPPAP